MGAIAPAITTGIAALGGPASAGLLGLGAVSTGLGIYEKAQAGAAQRNLYKSQMVQDQMSYTNKSIQETEQAQQIIGKDMATSAQKGIAAGSGSVGQVVNQNVANYNMNEKAAQTNLNFEEANLNNEMAASRADEWGGIFSSITQFGMQALDQMA